MLNVDFDFDLIWWGEGAVVVGVRHVSVIIVVVVV